MNPEDGIRRTMARYIHGIDNRDDARGVAELFTSNGKITTRMGSTETIPEIEKFLEKLWSNNPPDRASKHIHINSIIDMVSSTEAKVVTDVVIWGSNAGVPWAIGSLNRHHDHMVLDGNEWKFLEKSVKETHAFKKSSYKSPRD